MNDLIARIRSCAACEFRNPAILPLAPILAQPPVAVMFIGENPSWADNQDRPFAPTTISGKALRENYLRPLDLQEQDVWVTDLFKCRYPKDLYRAKAANDSRTQAVAHTCASLWLVQEVDIAQPRIVVTLGDKEVYQRLRAAFGWDTPATFAQAVGQVHTVSLGQHVIRLFPMVHPDVSRPLQPGDRQKPLAREKWAPIHQSEHVPALRSLLQGAP